MNTSHPVREIPEEVRLKYIDALSRKGSNWVYAGTGALLLLVADRMPGVAWLNRQSWGVWAILAGILLLLSGIVGSYASWRKRRLQKHSDKMLEVMYDDHRPFAVAGKIVEWLAFLAAVLFMLYVASKR